MNNIKIHQFIRCNILEIKHDYYTWVYLFYSMHYLKYSIAQYMNDAQNSTYAIYGYKNIFTTLLSLLNQSSKSNEKLDHLLHHTFDFTIHVYHPLPSTECLIHMHSNFSPLSCSHRSHHHVSYLDDTKKNKKIKIIIKK